MIFIRYFKAYKDFFVRDLHRYMVSLLLYKISYNKRGQGLFLLQIIPGVIQIPVCPPPPLFSPLSLNLH